MPLRICCLLILKKTCKWRTPCSVDQKKRAQLAQHSGFGVLLQTKPLKAPKGTILIFVTFFGGSGDAFSCLFLALTWNSTLCCNNLVSFSGFCLMCGERGPFSAFTPFYTCVPHMQPPQVPAPGWSLEEMLWCPSEHTFNSMKGREEKIPEGKISLQRVGNSFSPLFLLIW